jgi:hypothetical protein
MNCNTSGIACLRAACGEYDRLIADGKEADVPRTAHQLFRPGQIRTDMDRSFFFVNSNTVIDPICTSIQII